MVLLLAEKKKNHVKSSEGLQEDQLRRNIIFSYFIISYVKISQISIFLMVGYGQME